MTDQPKKTLKLKPGASEAGANPLRRPVRSQAPARARPLSEVQAERAARQAAWEARAPSLREPGADGRGGQPDRPPRASRADRSDRPLRDDRPARPQRPDRPAGGRPSQDDRRSRPAAGAPAAARPQTARPAPRSDGLIRLNKRLADLGLCSRREADEWIERGWVLVNGEAAAMGLAVSETDRVEVLPAAHRRQDSRVTILLHKPVGYVSGQPEDGHESAAVLIQARHQWRSDPHIRQSPGWQPQHARGLAPAGRLDIDSTGLLVLTQDGRIARQLIGEDSDIEKEYLVRVQWAPEGPKGPGVVAQDVQSVVPPGVIERLRHGLSLDGQPLKPAQVDWQNPEQLRFVLKEGKKRQIRRMCEQVGLHVVGLKRIRMGRIVLGNLPVGQWRYLRADEGF
ncbi:pseudouridine synthase [Hydrogenophaga sp.]|uniref:pseudouridine synthase n=1 Tax=Hydrogenophaga sp. TaxID=1904254 RepID=UPI0035AF96FB